jgi:para-nitrobenzyl esterase
VIEKYYKEKSWYRSWGLPNKNEKEGQEMKKLLLASLMIVLTITLNLVVFANPAQARNSGKHSGLLMDPIKIEGGYIAGTFFGDPDFPIHIYRGIPYAAPPVGDLRWKPPQPVEPWSGILESVNYSIHPVQWRTRPYYPGEPESEDCLYLNVLTPATNTNEKLPVIVYFHGGHFDGSSGNDEAWNFHRLPQHGVVMVTPNTRLAALGLLAHPELSAESPNGVSGNYAYLDMIAVLEWVQRNIAVFGGNPDNVTIWSQSLKPVGLMSSPLAKGLFHRAIIQSGGYVDAAPLSVAEAWGQEYFAKLGVTTLEEARALPWEELVEVYFTMPPYPARGLTVDGWFLMDTPLNIFAAGRQNAVLLIVQTVFGENRPGSTLIFFFSKLLEGNYNVGTEGYASIFDHVPASWKAQGILHTPHSNDLPYTFGIYDNPNQYNWVMFADRNSVDLPVLTEVDKMVSETIMTMWTQFAKTGDPNVPGKAKRSVYWPAWTPSGDQYIYWGDPIQIKFGFSEFP